MKDMEKKKISEIKLRLGTDLVDKIDKTIAKQQNRWGSILTPIGALAGGTLAYLYGPGSKKEEVFLGTFFGFAFGLNFGYLFGTLHGNYKLKRLKKKIPNLAEDIQEYLDYHNLCSYASIRPGISGTINEKYEE